MNEDKLRGILILHLWFKQFVSAKPWFWDNIQDNTKDILQDTSKKYQFTISMNSQMIIEKIAEKNARQRHETQQCQSPTPNNIGSVHEPKTNQHKKKKKEILWKPNYHIHDPFKNSQI